MQAPEIVMIGGGGHAKVLIDALRSSGETRSLGVLDANPERTGSLLLDEPIIGTDSLLEELAERGARAFVIAVGGTSDNRPRRDLFLKARALGLQPLTVRHPNAVVSRWATLRDGCQILAGAVVNAHATVGENSIINTCAVIEHDCSIADHVHIATGVRLASGVRVETLAHVGIGASVRQLVTIAAGSVVGAGAVVVKDVSSAMTVVGVPAKELHQ